MNGATLRHLATPTLRHASKNAVSYRGLSSLPKSTTTLTSRQSLSGPSLPISPRPVQPRPFSSTTQCHAREVRYVKFGESSSGEDKKKWRPFQDGEFDLASKIFIGVVGVGVIYYVVHLERIEETGRWRFIDISPEAERKLGQETDEEVFKLYGNKMLPQNHPITRRVAAIASRILTAADLGYVKGVTPEITSVGSSSSTWSSHPTGGDYGFDLGSWKEENKVSETKKDDVVSRLRQEWEVYVIKEDETPNAFVTGGGKIFVFTGILPIAKTDDGVATVLGHEIAHQVSRHVAEKASGSKVLLALVILLEILGLDVGFSRAGLALLMTLPNSRKVENEADSIGLRLMAQACFDPRESVGLWERMEEADQKSNRGFFGKLLGSGDFLSTHPANIKRIAALTDRIPAALQVRGNSSCGMADGSSIGDHFQVFKRAFGGL